MAPPPSDVQALASKGSPFYMKGLLMYNVVHLFILNSIVLEKEMELERSEIRTGPSHRTSAKISYHVNPAWPAMSVAVTFLGSLSLSDDFT